VDATLTLCFSLFNRVSFRRKKKEDKAAKDAAKDAAKEEKSKDEPKKKAAKEEVSIIIAGRRIFASFRGSLRIFFITVYFGIYLCEMRKFC